MYLNNFLKTFTKMESSSLHRTCIPVVGKKNAVWCALDRSAKHGSVIPFFKACWAALSHAGSDGCFFYKGDAGFDPVLAHIFLIKSLGFAGCRRNPHCLKNGASTQILSTDITFGVIGISRSVYIYLSVYLPFFSFRLIGSVVSPKCPHRRTVLYEPLR